MAKSIDRVLKLLSDLKTCGVAVDISFDDVGPLADGKTKLITTTNIQKLKNACINCGTEFAAGPGTSRKSQAKYCSNKCRVAYQRREA